MSTAPVEVDFLEAGSGPTVMLVHSSASGARQWRRLMDDLKVDFHVRAVNLFGYGKTPPWSIDRPQSLADQARLVEAALPANVDNIRLVGHSFGGVVAMKVAAGLSGRVSKLVLLETSPFYLLKQFCRMDAFNEAMELCDFIKTCGAVGEWMAAAERFSDYWNGAGAWQSMLPVRRYAFAQALQPLFFEWDAVMNETTPLEQWALLLPQDTLVVSDPNTVLPIREIIALLRRSCSAWTYKEIAGGGHMAPLTRPEIVNPLVCDFLRCNGHQSQTRGVEHSADAARAASR